VSVSLRGSVYELTTATELHELEELALADAQAFEPYPSATAAELAELAAKGHVLAWRDEAGQLVGCAQLLLSSALETELEPSEAYCYGSFLTADHQGRGFSAVLHRGQEVLARAAGKTRLWLTVRADNHPSIRGRLRTGFRIVDYEPSAFGDWDAGGARLVMVKDLVRDMEAPNSADPLSKPTGISPEAISRAVEAGSDDVLLRVGRDAPATDVAGAAATLIDAGYIGTAWAPDPSAAPTSDLVTFRRSGLVSRIRTRRPAVGDEFSPLREVVVNHTSFVSQIESHDAINEVAALNVGNVDPIAQADEYDAFISALRDEEVNVLRSGARNPEGRYTLFARDTSFVIGATPYIAHMFRRRRRCESRHLAHLFRGWSLKDARRAHGAYIEGGDVLVLDSERVVVGVGSRTNERGADLLEASLPGTSVIRVPHEDLHLDVLFTIVGRGLALIHRPGLPGEFLDLLDGLGYDFVECDPAEQASLGCNALALRDRRVIAAAGNEATNRALEAAGVEVIAVPMPNLIKHGGGPRCMTCPVVRGAYQSV
jgi:N-dimethylarginine dimethylaminohydrolase/GNAT superfamily N-acetyltransferase